VVAINIYLSNEEYLPGRVKKVKFKMNKLITLCLIFVLVFSLIGCSKETSTSSETSSETIKIGCILPFTGGSAYLGKLQKEGLDYCVEYYKEKGEEIPIIRSKNILREIKQKKGLPFEDEPEYSERYDIEKMFYPYDLFSIRQVENYIKS